ncbi:predicted protein [Nematostella vectensis]|uniref:Palmitoyltransferase n=1 Tax=Nematostella vectensis TaxID=45351 RepID=A7RWD7_NEMVE|nr:predicted protein [Nematostella vectensis]|eukprot:XP_001636361.1 predicted protein [Nematostella vectensis]
MAAKHWKERVLSRIFHIFITTAVVLSLFLTNTELKRSIFDGRWYYWSSFLILCVLGLVFYFIAGIMDPGYVETQEHNNILISYEKAEVDIESQSENESDNAEETCKILATPPFGSRLRRCGYCAIMQPLRTKHCEDCGRCVRKYDHHCPWLGTCVGERNHRFFWCFLVSQNALVAWAIEIAWHGFVYKDSWWDWVVANAFLLISMFILIFGMITVFLLLCCHTYLMVTAQTTWEYMSRSRISYLKTLSEDINPFDQGYLCNVYGFLCQCRIQKWEAMLRAHERWA